MGDICLWDLVYEFLHNRCPAVLNDKQAFHALHAFIHALLQETVRKEKRSFYEKVTTVCNN